MRLPLLTVLLCVASAADAAAPQADAAAPQTVYTDACAHCHTPGISGAPRLGDRADWSQRIRPGFKLLYQAAIEGVPNTTMAARGGNRELSDVDIRAVVDFMITAAALPQSTLAAARRYDALNITDRESSTSTPISTVC